MVGKRIGQYDILEELSPLSTGSLFVASDVRTGERVIVKVLPSGSLRSAALRQAVLLETRTAGGLRHPNILEILEVEESGDETIVVFGGRDVEPLSRRMARGAGSEPEVLDVALDVLGALEAAHQYGLLHGDVRPENILVDREGVAHLIGLGLGKRADRVRVSGLMRGPLSEYLAPEQVEKNHCDERSDLFSLGEVLYHWLTRLPPFRGADENEYRKSLLSEKPVPPSRRVPEVSQQTEQLILTALETDPVRRFQTASEMREKAEEARSRFEPDRRVRERKARTLTAVTWWRRRTVLGGAGLAVAVLALLLWWLGGEHIERTTVEDVVVLSQITDWPGVEADPAFSPDGSRVVFAAKTNGNWDLWICQVEGEGAVQLTETPQDERYPSWSPDGSKIAYSVTSAAGGIYVMPATGGPGRELSPSGFRPGWSPTGDRLVFDAATPAEGSRIWTIPADGGAVTKLTESKVEEERHLSLEWSPDGKEIMYEQVTDGQRNLWSVDAVSVVQRPITLGPSQDFDGAWDPSTNEIYFCSGEGNGVHIFRTSAHGGQRFPMTERASVYSGLSISSDGRRLAFSSVAKHVALWRVHISGETVEKIPTGLERTVSPAVSPDGRRIAVASNDRGTWDVYVVEDGTATMVAGTSADESHPDWSPDGTRVAFASRRLQESAIAMVDSEGSGQVAIVPSGVNVMPKWSPDGRLMVFVKVHSVGRKDVWVVDVDTGEAQPVTQSGVNTSARWSTDASTILFHSKGESWTGLYKIGSGGGMIPRWIADGRDGCWSPDGSKVAYSAGDPGREDIWILNLDQAVEYPLTTVGGGFYALAWSADGQSLAFLSDRHGEPELWVLPALGGEPTLLAVDTDLDGPPVWTPDSEWLLFTKEEEVDGDIWVYESF